MTRLDEKTARTFARGDFRRFLADADDRIATASPVRAGKRNAKLREIEKNLLRVFGKSLLFISHAKRHLDVYLIGVVNDGSAEILMTTYYADLKKRPKHRSYCIARISGHAVARLVQRRERPDALAALQQEIGVDQIDMLAKLLVQVEKGEMLQQGTEIETLTSGRFRVVGEQTSDGKIVLTLVTWLPPRK